MGCISTHWDWVMHIRVGKLTIIGSDNGLAPETAPSHCLKQWWYIVFWTLGNKLQGNFNRNSNIFIQENAFENVVWKMAATLSWPQCVNVVNVRHWYNWQKAKLLSPWKHITYSAFFNSFWPRDTIWRQRSGSTLAQVMVVAWRHQAIPWTNVD